MSRKRNRYLAGLAEGDEDLPLTYQQTPSDLEALPVVEFDDDSDFEDVHVPVRRRVMDEIFPPSADDAPPLPAVSDEELLAAFEKHDRLMRDTNGPGYEDDDPDVQAIMDGQLNGGIKKRVGHVPSYLSEFGYVEPEEPPALTALRSALKRTPEDPALRSLVARFEDKVAAEKTSQVVEVVDLLSPVEDPVPPPLEVPSTQAILDEPVIDNMYRPNFDPDDFPDKYIHEYIEPVADMRPDWDMDVEEVPVRDLETGEVTYGKFREVRDWDDEDMLSNERIEKLVDWFMMEIPQDIIKTHFGIKADNTGHYGIFNVMAQCVTRQLFDDYFDEERQKVMITPDLQRLVKKLTHKLYLGTPREKEEKKKKEQREIYQMLVLASRTVDGKVWKAFEAKDLTLIARLVHDKRYALMRARQTQGFEKGIISLQRKLRKVRDVRFLHDIPDGTPYLEAYRLANQNYQRQCYAQCSSYGTLSRQRLWYAAWCLMHQLYSGSKYLIPVRDCLSRFPILPEEMHAWKVMAGWKWNAYHKSWSGTLCDLEFINDYLFITGLYDIGSVDGYDPFGMLGFGDHMTNRWIDRFLMLPGVWDPLSYSKMIPEICNFIGVPYDENALVFSPLLAFADFGWAR